MSQDPEIDALLDELDAPLDRLIERVGKYKAFRLIKARKAELTSEAGPPSKSTRQS